RDLVVEEAPDGERLTVLQVDRGQRLILANRGNVEALDGQALAEVEGRDLRSDPQVDDLSVDDDRREENAHAELLELDRDRVVLLGDGEGELAARDELRLLAALGDEVGLGQGAVCVIAVSRA